MPEPSAGTRRTVFSTELGWMAIVGTGDVLQRLVFGYPTAKEAEEALGTDWLAQSRLAAWNDSLQRRLQDYAAGQCVEFDDIPVEMDGLTDFGRRVFLALRRVRYGQTTTYAALAAAAGSPRAARAVGNLMARNSIPLVLPCHRVVCSGKRIGNYSAPGGAAMKRQLLEMER
ncbi:MAG: methylated-DNA--[protein]-cysteine S-methyltransferase [Thermoguttaceae bacterium]|jgi:methylated-DNA-[protein]-cysteine S-methyltransferase|nr:methylated-DNA--[protein]-cysteine S-methyltransferase [Thermoguttaceae bacterium]